MKRRLHLHSGMEKDGIEMVKRLLAFGRFLRLRNDEILYPWIDRNLSITQTGELFSKFNEADETLMPIPKCREHKGT